MEQIAVSSASVGPAATPAARGPVLPGVQRFYNAMARHGSEAAFLNYGWAAEDASAPPSQPVAPGAGADDADAVAALGPRAVAVARDVESHDDLAADSRMHAYAAALYRRLFAGLPLAGARVLELGCGRGGGAAILLAEHGPLSYLGVDLGHLHVALCRRRLAAAAQARFAVADAERPPVLPGSVDVAVSLEAVHHFPSPDRFFAAVHDALAPGGRFAMAGIFAADALPDAALARCGLGVESVDDLTPGVLRSLAATSARRRTLVERLALPARFRPFLLSWAGAEGTPVFRRFVEGSLRYLRHVARRD